MKNVNDDRARVDFLEKHYGQQIKQVIAPNEPVPSGVNLRLLVDRIVDKLPHTEHVCGAADYLYAVYEKGLPECPACVQQDKGRRP